MLMMIMNCLTSTGSPNFIKHLTKIHCWFQKMFYKTSVDTPYKNTNCCTKILIAVKERLQMYCATVYARSRVNQMWILKNSKELLENLKYPIFSQIYSIKTYDFTTLYTTIPHDKLKTRLFNLIDSCFFNKNDKRKYLY